MNTKKSWSVVGLFMIMLVLSIPFYSANAMAASVQINRNSGEQNINRYLDAQGDTWTVQATITGSGVETINPADVKLKIGNNEASFTSCSAGTMGIVCEYLSPLTDGIQEAEYAFQVIYRFLNNLGVPDSVSNGEVIKADGSAPTVIITKLQQNAAGKVEIDFTVNDKVRQNAPAVGIKTVEILDADSGNVLQTISIPETGKEQYNYRNDGGFSGILQAPLAGEGLKRIKVRAEDWLGHQSAAAVRTFRADFIAPVIKDNLNFTSLGRFLGEFVVSTDITVDVEEASMLEVKATSSLANIDQRDADCEEDLEQIGLWHCTWQEVEVNPLQDTITVVVAAKDEFGNIAERTLTKTFTRDPVAPVAEFFGTERMFDGKSYVRSGRQRLILKVSEQGAGITAEGIRANLLALGGSNAVAPTECTSTDAGLECYWDTAATLTAGVARVGLSQFQDNVGNLGLSTEAELVVDNSGPKVEKVELYGGEKDYVQSNDPLRLKIKAIETSGMVILVNVNNLVMDAENKFPETPYTRNLMPRTGWQVFTEDSCEKTEGGFWECEILTDPVRSGPENNVNIEFRIQDTAGNEAADWPPEAKNAELRSQRNGPATLKFDLLGLSTEENPDYWEAVSIVPLGGTSAFIDLETTPLTFTRLPFEVRLRSVNTHAKMVSIDLQGCTAPEQAAGNSRLPAGGEEAAGEESAATEAPAAIPTLSRSLLYSGVSADGEPSPRPKIVLEFEPFDGKEMFNLPETGGEGFTTRKVEYTCQFRIFSMVDGNALANAELQEVRVGVPFGYSTLGALDAKLEEKIENAREQAGEGLLGFIGKLEKIIKWLRYIAQAASMIVNAQYIITVAQKATEGPINFPPTKPGGIAACFGLNTAVQWTSLSLNFLSTPLTILSCNVPSGISWYDSWVNYLPQYYNELMNTLESPIKPSAPGERWRSARGVSDNLYLSIAALCVPGIIHNVDKYRQIICREIYCLENEVKANVATVESCSELRGLMTCKYFVGELWYILPFSQFYDSVIGLLQRALRDPIALAHTLTIIGCGVSCAISGTLAGGCNLAYWLWSVIDWIEGTVGFIYGIAADLESGGLTYCDSVL